MNAARWTRAVVATVLASAGLANSADAQEIVLRFNRWVPATHHFQTRIMGVWAERVATATKGRVKVEFTAASLGAPSRQFDLSLTGVADLTAGNQAYTPERFVVSRIAELPFLGDNAEALSVAQWRVQEKYLYKANEYRGTKLLAVFNNGPSEIFTTKKPINTVADLKGLKLRTSLGTGTEISTALDIVQVSGPITDAYEMLSRGIADGTTLAPDSIRSFQLDKSLQYQTRVPGGLYNSAFFLVMNEAKWKSLPPDIQQQIMSVSGETMARESGRVWDDQDRMANEQFAHSGMKTMTLSDSALKELKTRLAGIEETWIKQAEAKGVDGRAALEMFRREVKANLPR